MREKDREPKVRFAPSTAQPEPHVNKHRRIRHGLSLFSTGTKKVAGVCLGLAEDAAQQTACTTIF